MLTSVSFCLFGMCGLFSSNDKSPPARAGQWKVPKEGSQRTNDVQWVPDPGGGRRGGPLSPGALRAAGGHVTAVSMEAAPQPGEGHRECSGRICKVSGRLRKEERKKGRGKEEGGRARRKG